jgi:hypothetical protein
MKIVVQISDREWTMQAVHFACAMARNTESTLVLLQLWPVTNAGLLGTGIGADALSARNALDIEEYETIAEDYGVPLVVQPMECESLIEATMQAAAQLKAAALFMHLSQRRFAFWHQFQVRHIQRRLAAFHCRLYLCDRQDQNETWLPSVGFPAVKHL